nr:uncharacterized protein LOC104084715 [Nicotiana tomentosiformis]
MKLTPEKCAFGVGSDKFIGFVVSQRGIELNHNKIKAIEDIPDQLTSVKEVQRLTGTEKYKKVLFYPSAIVKIRRRRATIDLSSTLRSRGKRCLVREEEVLDVDGYCEVNSTNLIWDWRNEFIEYLRHGKLPEDPKASRALQTKVACYCIVYRKIYMRSFQGPLARCLGTSKVDYVMREVHEGVCGNHSGADFLVLKLVRVGYYWPRMEQDTKKFVQKYDKR